MKDAARLQSCLEILTLQRDNKNPLDQICHTYYKTRRYIGSKDRQEISALVYGVMRHRGTCDWWALKRGLSPLLMGAYEGARIRLLAYLWLFKSLSRDKFGILFSGEKYAPARLTEREKVIFSDRSDSQSRPPWVEGEFPEWLFPFLKRRFGEALPQEMAAFITQAPLDLRVNTLKAHRDQAKADLEKAGFFFKETPFSSWGLRREKRENMTQTQAFQKGLVEIQDEGSQLVVHLMGVNPGDSVLDLCAGAGGKTLAIAACLENKGRVVATDTALWRLKRAKERLKRAGVFNVDLREISGPSDKWLKRQKGRFDHVLVDAPCSGSGTWRRNPDQKWNVTEKDLEELSSLQKILVDTAGKSSRGICDHSR